jgi:hypothetical protein
VAVHEQWQGSALTLGLSESQQKGGLPPHFRLRGRHTNLWSEAGSAPPVGGLAPCPEPKPDDVAFHEQTDSPIYADDRNFYKVEKWTRDVTKVDRMVYALQLKPSRHDHVAHGFSRNAPYLDAWRGFCFAYATDTA